MQVESTLTCHVSGDPASIEVNAKLGGVCVYQAICLNGVGVELPSFGLKPPLRVLIGCEPTRPSSGIVPPPELNTSILDEDVPHAALSILVWVNDRYTQEPRKVTRFACQPCHEGMVFGFTTRCDVALNAYGDGLVAAGGDII
jgi:hypothetical protein